MNFFIKRQDITKKRMTYVSNSGNGYQGLERAVNRVYNVNINLNIGTMNINNGIQHSIAAEQGSNVVVYNNIESIVNQNRTTNYVVNLDNRRVEFLSPYIGSTRGKTGTGYLERGYGRKLISNDYNPQPLYENSITTGLLKKNRPRVQFIEEAEEIRPLVEETFKKVTGEEFPKNIEVRLCSEKEMKEAHSHFGGTWNPGIMGFAINRTEEPSLVFIRKGELDSVMLTTGHEIGHVLTTTLGNNVDEEAKAFAFEMAWVKAIIEKNIGGLAGNFNPEFIPAKNGLHDKAFGWVQKLIKNGKEALRIFKELASGLITTNRTIQP